MKKTIFNFSVCLALGFSQYVQAVQVNKNEKPESFKMICNKSEYGEAINAQIIWNKKNEELQLQGATFTLGTRDFKSSYDTEISTKIDHHKPLVLAGKEQKNTWNSLNSIYITVKHTYRENTHYDITSFRLNVFDNKPGSVLINSVNISNGIMYKNTITNIPKSKYSSSDSSFEDCYFTLM